MKLTPDGKEILEDGEVLRRPMIFMDNARHDFILPKLDLSLHAPGYAMLTDAQAQARQRMYADADRKLQNAWKAPASATDTKAPSRVLSLDAAREKYESRLRNAWRAR